MNKILITFLCFFFTPIVSIGHASEVDQGNPYAMVKQVANQTFVRIKSERKKIESNPLFLNKIVEEELFPYFDYRFSAFKVLGKDLRKYSKDKINAYAEAFKAYSISMFSNALQYYNDQTVKFEAGEDYADKRYVTVRAYIKDPHTSTKLFFLVRKHKKSGQWRLYDITVEGISLLSSLKSQFESKFRKEGLNGVMNEMLKHNRE